MESLGRGSACLGSARWNEGECKGKAEGASAGEGSPSVRKKKRRATPGKQGASLERREKTTVRSEEEGEFF